MTTPMIPVVEAAGLLERTTSQGQMPGKAKLLSDHSGRAASWLILHQIGRNEGTGSH